MRLVASRAALVGAAALAAAALPGAAAAAPACPVAPSPVDEASLTVMINQTRAAQGVAKVKKDQVLMTAGRRKSMAMAKGAAFAHSSGGKLPWAKGRAAGQNIAMAPSAAAAFQAMLKSPGHRANILGRSWRFTGVGAAMRCDGMVFFTVNLMAPKA
ncbi:MAG TPA: CAP domain-containing protein [Miltoncostaeaceae bacterium]|nr:CAP domain-containing protein [Miltoncostaeaceae bacterium]